MANRTVQNKQLRPNQIILVRGTLTFGRLMTQYKDVEGNPELTNDKKNRQARGLTPIEKPYTTATICNATLIPASGNIQSCTPEEIYVYESFYQSRSQSAQGASYTAYNKSKNTPAIYQVEDLAKKTFRKVLNCPSELARGLDVIMVIRTFPGQQNNNGVSLDAVLVCEPLRYYSNDLDLSAYGITTLPAENEPAPTFGEVTTPFNNMPDLSQKPAPSATPFTHEPARPAQQETPSMQGTPSMAQGAASTEKDSRYGDFMNAPEYQGGGIRYNG